MIILIRHGEADKAKGRAIGQEDLPLSAAGKKQAGTLAQSLSSLSIDYLYTSPLKRTRATATPLEKAYNKKAIICPELTEINLGLWDGLSFEQIKKDFPSEYEKRGQNIATYRPPEGESFADLAERVRGKFQEITDKDAPTIIVTHAGVIRVIMHMALGIPLNNIFQFSPSHCHATILKKSHGKLCLTGFNIPPDAHKKTP
ncbi:histidine phosphatase family protein [Maridesulfovibrio frigidus]|uniref:histidine phosphatase family protein n=1 Tax=Maridesulfovibrio frigidus TaxID=340956 RepID=UPI0004E1BA4D|nr:histidine phosphatase family protein [Maridesulfovibrio frigidus]